MFKNGNIVTLKIILPTAVSQSVLFIHQSQKSMRRSKIPDFSQPCNLKLWT